MALLSYLIEQRGRVVSKEELLERVWPDVVVGEMALTSAVRDLRRALSEGSCGRSLIENRPGQGYRFAGEIEASTALPDRAPPRSAPGSSRRPLLERDAELARLERVLEDVRKGQGRVALLLGPPGIGKTSLAEEVLEKARASGYQAHVGRCYARQSAPGFWPWIQLLRSPGNGDRSTPDGVWDPLGLAADAEPRAGLADARQSRIRIAARILDRLVAAASAAPRILLIEDLHWADADSLAVLEFVAQSLDGVPILLLVTAREEDAHESLQRLFQVLGRVRASEQIQLAALSEAAVGTLLSERAATAPGERLTRQVFTASGGNPLFVSELAHLCAQGQLTASESESIPVPARVRDAIELHVDSRSDDCKQSLRHATILGDEFDLETLGQLADLAGPRILAAIAEAEASGFVHEMPNRPARYEFRHSMYRESLYAGFPRAELRRLHLRAGEILERRYAHGLDSHLGELARHFVEAAAIGGAEKALLYTRTAAERSTAQGALEEAGRFHAQALQLLEFFPSPSARLQGELYLSRAKYLALIANSESLPVTDEVGHVFAAATRFAREADAADLLAEAAIGQVFLFLNPFVVLSWWSSESKRQELAELLEEASARVAADEVRLRAGLRIAGAVIAVWAGEVCDARRQLREAAPLIQGLQDLDLRITALVVRWFLAQDPDSLPERLEIAAEARDLAQILARRELGKRLVLLMTSAVLAESGRMNEVQESLREVRRSLRGEEPTARIWSVMQEILAGRFAGAEAAMQDLASAPTNIRQNPLVNGAMLIQRFWIHLYQRLPTELLSVLDAAIAAMPGLVLSRLLRAAFHAELGRVAEARAELERVCKQDFADLPFDREWLPTLCFAAPLVCRLGSERQASVLYKMLEPYEDRIAIVCWTVVCLGSVARPLGILAARERRWERAVAHLERAVACHDRLGARFLAAEARFDLAHALAARRWPGDAARAQLTLEQAQASAADLGLEQAFRR
jgi:hypothetical protein